MPRSKKAKVVENDEQVLQGEGLDAAALAKELNDVVSIWRPTHVISGRALEFVKEKVAAINEALNPEEGTEEDNGIETETES